MRGLVRIPFGLNSVATPLSSVDHVQDVTEDDAGEEYGSGPFETERRTQSIHIQSESE
jgi:hypothetical protein